jgi:hypothetical protein
VTVVRSDPSRRRGLAAAAVCVFVALFAAWEAAERVEAAADDRRARAAASVCGVPIGPVVDFARLRLVRQAIVPGVPLPAFLPEGRYTVALSPPSPGTDLPDGIPERIFAGQTDAFREESSPDGGRRIVAEVDIAAPGAFLAPLAPQPSFEPFFAEAEVSWSVSARLRQAASGLRAALAAAPTP